MPAALRDVLASLAVYALLTLSYHGWGEALGRLLLGRWRASPWAPQSGVATVPWDRHFISVWSGWAWCLFLFQALQCLFPLQPGVTLTVFGAGVALFAAQRVAARRSALGSAGRGPAVWACGAAALAAAVWIALRAMLPPCHYDNGLYHFGVIRWLNEYAVVPGLANLHLRLAFNQAFLVHAASLNFGPGFHHAHNFAIAYLVWLVVAEGFFAIPQSGLGLRASALEPGRLASILFLPVAGWFLLETNISSPTPDAACFMVQTALFLQLWRLAVGEAGAEERALRAALVTVVAAATATLKQSALVPGLLSAAVAWGLVVRRGVGRAVWRPLLGGALVGGAMALVWLARGAIQSGYPFFPWSGVSVQADWTAPRAEVDNFANGLYSFAREPHTHWSQVLGNWRWFGPWLQRMAHEGMPVLWPLGIGSVALVAAACWPGRRRAPWLVMAALLGSFVFWFLMAPDPRFAGSLFWQWAVGGLGVLACRWGCEALRGRLAVALLAVVLLPASLWLAPRRWLIAQVSTSGFQPMPVAQLEARVTDSGLRVWVPVGTDQAWDAGLPNTPYFIPALRLRGDGLGSGFALEEKKP